MNARENWLAVVALALWVAGLTLLGFGWVIIFDHGWVAIEGLFIPRDAAMAFVAAAGCILVGHVAARPR